MVVRCTRSTVENNCSMSPLQPVSYTIFLGQVHQIFNCVLVLYFKIILDYVCCSSWVWINMDLY